MDGLQKLDISANKIYNLSFLRLYKHVKRAAPNLVYLKFRQIGQSEADMITDRKERSKFELFCPRLLEWDFSSNCESRIEELQTVYVMMQKKISESPKPSKLISRKINTRSSTNLFRGSKSPVTREKTPKFRKSQSKLAVFGRHSSTSRDLTAKCREDPFRDLGRSQAVQSRGSILGDITHHISDLSNRMDYHSSSHLLPIKSSSLLDFPFFSIPLDNDENSITFGKEERPSKLSDDYKTLLLKHYN